MRPLKRCGRPRERSARSWRRARAKSSERATVPSFPSEAVDFPQTVSDRTPKPRRLRALRIVYIRSYEDRTRTYIRKHSNAKVNSSRRLAQGSPATEPGRRPVQRRYKPQILFKIPGINAPRSRSYQQDVRNRNADRPSR